MGLRPCPCPWAGDPTPLDPAGQHRTLTHHFHGNPQRLWADLLCSRLLSLCPVFVVLCPLQSPPPRMDTHFSWRGCPGDCPISCFVTMMLCQMCFPSQLPGFFSSFPVPERTTL